MHDATKSYMSKRSIQRSKQPKDLNVKEYEKGIDTVSDSILHVTFKNIPLVKFWYNIKEEYS